MTLHMHRIDDWSFYGKIWWNFDIDDVYFRESGTNMREDDLPIVHFEFIGDSDELNPLPTSLLEYIDIVIISYWKMTPLLSRSKSNWILRLVPWHLVTPGSTSGAQAAYYSNIFQRVALKINPKNLQKRCDYIADVVVNPEGSNPHKVKIDKHTGKFVNVIPAVVNGKYITFTDFKF